MIPAGVALSGSELASYHGVEHKAIAAYEHGSRDPRTAAKEHQRCGSNLIGPMMIFTVAGQAIMDRLPKQPGPLARWIASVASLSLAVETFAYAERNPGLAARPRRACRRRLESSACSPRASRTRSRSRSGSPRWTRSLPPRGRTDLRADWTLESAPARGAQPPLRASR